MQKMTLKYTLESSIFEDEHHDNCSICGRHFVYDETTHLGYSIKKQLIYVGDCCKKELQSTIVRRVYSKRDYIKPNMEASLWRYLSLAKFVALLKDKSLFFSRADQFSDPFEGAKGVIKYENQWDSFYKEYFRKAITDSPEGVEFPYKTEEQIQEQCDSMLRDIKRSGKNLRLQTFINCWHENSHESEAMWKLYCSDLSQGIAIKTTYGRLFHVLNQKKHIQVGRVQYIDYSKRLLGPNGSFWYKRKSFEHEKEVRAIIHHFHDTDMPALGINMPVDLNELIQEIYVSPTAPHWFFELIQDICIKYKINKEVQQSHLRAEPFY